MVASTPGSRIAARGSRRARRDMAGAPSSAARYATGATAAASCRPKAARPAEGGECEPERRGRELARAQRAGMAAQHSQFPPAVGEVLAGERREGFRGR